MANQEAVSADATQDTASHVADYSRFTKLLKWGAIVCFIIGMAWMMIVKAYW